MGFPNIKQVLAFSLALCSISPSSAEEEILSSFRIQMPRGLSYGENKLLENHYSIKESKQLENLNLDSKYPTWAENIKMNLSAQLSPLKIWNFSQAQDFELNSLKVDVLIGQTKTVHTEVRESPGSSVTIDLNAQCSNIRLKLIDAKAQLKGQILIHNEGSRIKLELSETSMQWNDKAWQVSNFSCQGVTGFERLARQEIEKYLKTPDSLQEQIYQEIKKEVLNLQNEINASIFKQHKIVDSADNFILTMEPQLLLPHKENEDFRFDGVTRLRYRGLSLNNKKSESIYFKSSPPPTPYQEGPSFSLPLELLQPLFEKLFRNGNLIETWWSDELEGFSDFMESETQRKHVWPEMLNYNSKSRFKFQAKLIETPQLSQMTNSGERVEINVQSTLVIQMFAPKGNGYVPYVEWKSPIMARISIQVYQGGLWYKIMSSSQFKWSARMLPHYINTYHPKDTSIDAERIGDEVVEALIKKQYRWAIPEWKISDKLRYQAVKMFRTETLLWIYWKEI